MIIHAKIKKAYSDTLSMFFEVSTKVNKNYSELIEILEIVFRME